MATLRAVFRGDLHLYHDADQYLYYYCLSFVTCPCRVLSFVYGFRYCAVPTLPALRHPISSPTAFVLLGQIEPSLAGFDVCAVTELHAIRHRGGAIIDPNDGSLGRTSKRLITILTYVRHMALMVIYHV